MTWNKTLSVGARTCRCTILLAMVASWCALSNSSFAATTNWTGSTNDLWTEAGNWDNGVPGSGDTANILGTFGSPFNVDLNGTQIVENISLTSTFTTFTNGTFDQNRNPAAPFNATDVTFTSTGRLTDPGNVNWTRVTRPNANTDDNWNSGNAGQIQFTDVESDTGTAYRINNMNGVAAGAGYDATVNNSKIFHFNYVNNPTGPNSGSLSLTNGTEWETSQVFSAGTGTGVYTLNIDNSTLKLSGNGAVTLGSGAILTTTNATLDMGINKVLNAQMGPANFDGSGLTWSQRSGSGTVGAFEALSQDIGPWLDGYVVNSGNFSFDTLVLENRFRRILLQDSFDNSTGVDPEAIYVETLDASFLIRDQTVTTEGLDLQGHNIYYQTLVGDLANWNVYDSVGGGSIQQVTSFLPVVAIPEPSTAWLAGLGIALLAGHRRRKRNAA